MLQDNFTHFSPINSEEELKEKEEDPKISKRKNIIVIIIGASFVIALAIYLGIHFGIKNSKPSNLCKQWQQLFHNHTSGSNISLTKNIDCQGKTIELVSNFRGNIDGAGFSLKNFVIQNPSKINSEYCLGIFGYFNGIFKNINFENVQFLQNAKNYDYISQGLICYAEQSLLTNISLTGMISLSETFTNQKSGFLVGQISKTEIDSVSINISVEGKFRSANFGGMIGYSSYGLIHNISLIMNGNFEAEYEALFGGICGESLFSSFGNCKTFFDIVTQNSSFGGLIGHASSTSFLNTESSGKFVSMNSASNFGGLAYSYENHFNYEISNFQFQGTATFNELGSKAGGVAAISLGDIHIFNSSVQAEINNVNQTAGYIGGLEGNVIMIFKNCQSFMDFNDCNYIGGFAFQGDLSIINSSTKINIKNSKSQTKLFGGIIAYGNIFSQNCSVQSQFQNNIFLQSFGGIGTVVESVKIENTYVKINSINFQLIGGGLIGESKYMTSIKSSYFDGYIFGNKLSIFGGLIGRIDSSLMDKTATISISESFSEGSASNLFIGGGIIGLETGTNNILSIDNVFSTFNILNSTNSSGGLLGLNQNSNTSIYYSYSAAKISSQNQSQAGGLVGFGKNSLVPQVKDSFWDTVISGILHSNGGEAKSTSEMKKKRTFKKWDSSIWEIKNGYYPILKSFFFSFTAKIKR